MEKPMYYVGKSGNKYPYGNMVRPNPLFPSVTEMYINYETDRGRFKALPLNDYPYTVEFICVEKWAYKRA